MDGWVDGCFVGIMIGGVFYMGVGNFGIFGFECYVKFFFYKLLIIGSYFMVWCDDWDMCLFFF